MWLIARMQLLIFGPLVVTDPTQCEFGPSLVKVQFVIIKTSGDRGGWVENWDVEKFFMAILMAFH